MTKRDKKLDKLMTATDMPVDIIKALIKRHFSSGNVDNKSGSHIVISDPRFTNVFGTPELCIPVCGGQKVKGFYLKRLRKAIEIVNEENDEDILEQDASEEGDTNE